MKGLQIRPIEQGDAGPLESWLFESRTEPFFPMGDAPEIEEAAKRWVAMGVAERSGVTAVYQGAPVGIGLMFLQTYRRLVHQCAHILVVSAEYRRMGIGSELIEGLMELGRERGVELIHVEVYDDPGVETFYRKAGFVEYARQGGWAKDTTKDPVQYRARICMERYL